MRLDKYLCDMGLGTRSQVRQIIRKGTVTVDGRPASGPEQRVEASQAVCVDGKRVSYVEKEYLKRLSMGSLKLDPGLKPGEYRPLTPEGLQLLQEETGC